jgi:hypothetical protein
MGAAEERRVRRQAGDFGESEDEWKREFKTEWRSKPGVGVVGSDCLTLSPARAATENAPAFIMVNRGHPQPHLVRPH